ncbi:Transcriptional regulator [Fructobacillus fructosus]|uniref:Contains XRE-family HTH domain (HipB) n=1 Tax=Fructobacillus fructosus TaxID=1631 RepID=A0ABN9YTX2_9LACO|nr:Transcriptional regulator [Fructobacillus fructosus]
MANRLKELRKEKGYTLNDIAKATGITRGTYNNYENEKTEPKLATWQKLADFFGVDIGYLQGISKSKNALHDKNASDFDQINQTFEEQFTTEYLEELLRYILKEVSNENYGITERGYIANVLQVLGYENNEKLIQFLFILTYTINNIAAYKQPTSDETIDLLLGQLKELLSAYKE